LPSTTLLSLLSYLSRISYLTTDKRNL
jgi:hypothetical protein